MKLPLLWFAPPLLNLAESVIDCFRDRVSPIKGSVVYCDLIFGYMEHSGIYIGNDQIVHVNSQGQIAVVCPSDFIDGTTALNIYVSCRDEYAVGCEQVAGRALERVGGKVNYNFLINNCHNFTVGCLTGAFEDKPFCFLTLLKGKAKSTLYANTWRQWDIEL